MTFSEVLKGWDELCLAGRFSFLLKSSFMKQEYPEDNEEFIKALDRFAKAQFEDLPWELQDEFSAYTKTTIFENWMKGGESCVGV